jgi:hypothetical protein
MKTLAPFLLFFILLQSCSYKDTISTVSVDNDFSMEVPSYLKVDDEVKPGAPFGYTNRFRNIYSTVFFEEKGKVADTSFQQYYNRQIKVLKSALIKPGVSDSTFVNVGGASGIHTELSGVMQTENIYYSHLLLETPNRYYQVCVWTRGEDRKLKYGKDIENILFSFKLLKP